MDTIRRKLFLLLFGVLVFFGVFVGSFVFHLQKKGEVVVGAKNCTEGHILSEIVAQLIESKMGVTVLRKYSLDGTFVSFNALKGHAIDLYVEYTGTAYTALLKKRAEGKKRGEVFEELKDHFLKEFGIVWMEPLGFQNRYALMVTPKVAKHYYLKTLSDLQRALDEGKEVRLAFDPEFFGREERELIEEGYRINAKKGQLMDHALLYLTLFRGGVEVINGYGTDGFAKGLIQLEDDQELFPSYDAAIVVLEKALKKYPELEGVLRRLSGAITEDDMRQMNSIVENNGESVHNAANAYLKTHHLL